MKNERHNTDHCHKAQHILIITKQNNYLTYLSPMLPAEDGQEL